MKLTNSALEAEWNAMVDYLEFLTKAAESRAKELPPVERGITVYFPVCKQDGTTVYVPLKVYGAIYNAAAGTYQDITAEAGDIPDESTLIQ